MKKGLTLALLMVAMVALVVSTSANAPTIDIPSEIIVGNADAGELDAGTGQSLMRYSDAIDVNAEVDWNNDGYTWDKFWLFWIETDSDTDIEAVVYDDTQVRDPLTATELTEMADSNVEDISTQLGADIADRGFQGTSATFSLGFLDAALHATLAVAGQDPYNATPAASGAVIADTYTNDTTVTMVAAVTSGVLGLRTDWDEVHLLFQAGSEDGGGSTNTYDFDTSDEGWKYLSRSGGVTDVVADISPIDAAGIGFDLAASVANGYSQWKCAPTWAASVPDGGDAYKIVAVLNTDTNNPMGYRFTYNNIGWTHYGEVLVKKDRPAFATPNLPSASSDFEVRMYFEPPTQLEQMGDTEYQANGAPAQDGDFPGTDYTDLRIYSLTFDAIAVTGDLGKLQMSTLDVLGYSAPTVQAADVEIDFGSSLTGLPTSGSPIAMNTANAWRDDSNSFSAPYVGGSTNIGSTLNLTLPAAADNQWGLAALVNDYSWYDQNLALQPAANTLYRLQFEASCADLATCPVFRTSGFVVVADNPENTGDPINPAVFGRMSWQENFGGGWSLGAGKLAGYIPTGTGPGETMAQPNTSPCAPSATASAPSVVSSYVYTHNVPSVSGNDRVVLATSFSLVDTLFQGSITNYTASVWAYPSATVSINYAGWQNLGNGN